VLCEQNPVHVVFVVNRFVTFTFCGIMAAMLVVCRPQRQNAGLVDGVLVDEYGKPVVDASIRAYPADRGFTFAHGSGTDVKGTFTSGIT
jgi:hypothetical protein